MARKTQWIMSAAEVAEHVAGINPRMAQRAYLVADGGELTSVIVVTSVKSGQAAGYSIDVKDSVRVKKAQVEQFLTNSGETMPRNTRMFVRPDPALSSTGTQTTALEVVITDDTLLGGV